MTSSSYPIKWRSCTPEEMEDNNRLYETKNKFGFCVEKDNVTFGDGKIRMPRKFLDSAEKIYNMEVRPDDIWIVTFKKCGTTMTQV